MEEWRGRVVEEQDEEREGKDAAPELSIARQLARGVDKELTGRRARVVNCSSTHTWG